MFNRDSQKQDSVGQLETNIILTLTTRTRCRIEYSRGDLLCNVPFRTQELIFMPGEPT